jgi:PAS domain S-box-containing protein
LMDGIQFLVEVRTHFGLIPFILFTGRGREEVVIQAINNGANFYLQKGGDPTSQFAELRHKILAAVEHRRADTQVTILNRLYTVLSATNRAIIRIPEKKELLKEICRIGVDDGGFTMVWAGIANPINHLIEPMAAHGPSEGYLDRIRISTDDGPGNRGPTSTAFREGIPTVCNEIASDERMKPVREPALNRGFRSLAAFPFAPDTRNAGVITFYASEPGFFTDQIIRLLEEQSHDLSFAFTTSDYEEQRIAAANDLKISELQYRRLFETAQDAILILDGKSGEIIDANKFILDMLGYPLEYFIGKHLWELGFMKDKSIAQRAFNELKTEGYIRYEDIPLEKKSGRIFNVEFISNVYLVGDKKIFQCNIRDITDRKRAEDAIAESDARMNSIIQGSPLPQFVIDRDHRVISWNRAIEEYSGVKEAEVKGKRVPWIILYDTERPVLADLLVDEKVEKLAEWY